jgi:hypothetical protein
MANAKRQAEHEASLAFWGDKAQKALAGRTIVRARYLTEEEREALGWGVSVLVIELDDGSLLYPSMDDEGNEGGAMFGQDKDGGEQGFPVIRNYAG